MEWDYWVRYFLYDISLKVMPWTLFDATSTIFWVVKLVVTCWDRGLLLIDYWTWISFAISSGFVSIILCLSIKQSCRKVSLFLKTFLLLLKFLFSFCFFGYSCCVSMYHVVVGNIGVVYDYMCTYFL